MGAKKTSLNDIELLRSRKGKTATMEFNNENYPDGYNVKIIKVNDDGTFTAKLIDVWSCM